MTENITMLPTIIFLGSYFILFTKKKKIIWKLFFENLKVDVRIPTKIITEKEIMEEVANKFV